MKIIFIFVVSLICIQLINAQVDYSVFPKAEGNINFANSNHPEEIDSLFSNKYQQEKINYLNKRISTGEIPDINYKLTTMDGKVFHKSDFKGKIVVFHYFCCYDKNIDGNDSWRNEDLPALNQVAKELECDDVLFFAFPSSGSNEKKRLLKFFKNNPFYFNVVSEHTQSFFNLYSVETFPKTIIFNKNGKVIAWVRQNNPEWLIYTIRKSQ